MTVAIVAELFDETTQEYKTRASFETFDAFYQHALNFKKSGRETTLMRVHVPGRFILAPSEVEKLNALGVTRI